MGSAPGDERSGDAGAQHSASVPRALERIAAQVRDSIERPARVDRILAESLFPMATVDSERRFLDVNRPARLIIRQTLEELRRMKIDDLTPRDGFDLLDTAWNELIMRGTTYGAYELAFADETRLEIVYWAASFPLRARHLIIFIPATWSEHELAQSATAGANLSIELTPRELEVLRLAAMGNSAAGMADQLVIGESTVKTHLTNIYAKLGVSDRAAAVATAIRTGLID
jgi:DNA-binding CsgD family transcriptional regulator